MKTRTSWRQLYEVALAERGSRRLEKHLRAAELAMAKAAERLLNRSNGAAEYGELMLAMRTLYEHGLRNGINIPGGTLVRVDRGLRQIP